MEGGRIIQQERGGEVIVNEALENFKSMYYLLKGKRDTDIKLFNDDRVINRSDIIVLNQKINDKLYTITINSRVTSVTVTLTNNEVKDFGNWLAFEDYDWHQACHTHSILIEWDFNAIFPNQTTNIPQTHTVRLRIGSGLRPHEFFHVMMVGGEDFEIGEAMSDMVCKIDFVNNHLCTELRAIITDWYNALPKNKPSNSLVKLSSKNKGKIELFINFMLILTCVFIINVGLKALLPFIDLSTNDKIVKWVYLSISASFPLFFVILTIGNFYSNRIIEKTIGRFRRSPMIILTRGDSNKVTETKGENNKLLQDLAWKIAVTICANLIGLGFGQFLPDILKKILDYYLH